MEQPEFQYQMQSGKCTLGLSGTFGDKLCVKDNKFQMLSFSSIENW
jgi:hypothetical protein